MADSGRPGKKCQAAALSIKRGVKLRPIKRCNEGPPSRGYSKHEQHARTGGESPYDYLRRNDYTIISEGTDD